MKAIHDDRNPLLPPAAAATPAGAAALPAVSTDLHHEAENFLKDWMTAWNERNANALAALHTIDCVTLNRYGTLLPGRQSAEQALSFLLGPHGPFGAMLFAPMQIVVLREAAPGVLILQASWTAPALGPDGQTVPDHFNPMMLSYTLIRSEGRWKTTQIDAHNVVPMELPFSNPDQKR